MDYTDITYTVTLTIPEDSSIPTEQEIATAIYQGVKNIDTEDAINVERN